MTNYSKSSADLSLTGLVSEIQRFSLHDGPGIRTTVFLKGCPLRCFWCHNPETWQENPELRYCANSCVNCGGCAEVCKNGAHAVVCGIHVLNRKHCEKCGMCVDACWAGALELTGVTMTPEGLHKEIAKDKAFYESSGGGVTLSGGEPLSQHLFCREILRLCKSDGVHCAIETSGYAQWDAFESVIPYLDLVILDIKLMDDIKHQEYTGASNALILENAKRLSRSGVDLIVRTPVVPGINDNTESIREIYRFIKDFANLIAYELMPYHKLADAKFESLGITNPGVRLKAVEHEETERLYREAVML